MTRKGDFRVSEITETNAERLHAQRSEAARKIDEQRRAPVTTNIGRWRDNKDDLDYPGVDTPREDPVVLPKDLKQSERPTTTGRASGEQPMEVIANEPFEVSENGATPPVFRTELANTDVSLAPDEAFGGVGATSSRELGGFNGTRGSEESPLTEPDPPDELFETGFGFGYDDYTDDPRDDITGVYEDLNTDLPDDVGLQEFARRTRRKQREFGGAPDEEGAALMVVDELGFGGGR